MDTPCISLLHGVEVQGPIANTSSILMRARNGTVRFLQTQHNLQNKTIHLRSTKKEQPV